MNDRVAIIGFGRVGQTLAFMCRSINIPLSSIISQKQSSYFDIFKFLQQNKQSQKIYIGQSLSSLIQADLIFIATPDSVIENTVKKLVSSELDFNNKYICHLSGAMPSEVLSPLKTKGAAITSCHPILSFTQNYKYNAENFAETFVSIEGEIQANEKFKQLFAKLGANCIKLAADKKAQYHASFVFSCNFINTLIASSNLLLKDVFEDETITNKLSTQLAKQTLSNIAELGPKQALTGPLMRGDKEIVTKHIAALKEISPELKQLYEHLNEVTMQLLIKKN